MTSTDTVFPVPDGQYSVGCADLMVDGDGIQVESCGVEWLDEHKGVFLRLFYPTVSQGLL